MKALHGLLAVLLVACCKHSETTTEDATPHHDTPAATTTTPAATPPPPAPKVIPSSKPPFESVTFTPLDRKTKAGWPVYEATNVGDKPVTYMAIYAFAYDKNDKLVKVSSPPLSWNGTIAPGEKSSFAIEIGEFSHDPPVPDTATSFELCYSSIKFDNADPKSTTTDAKRCGPNKAKGKP